MTFAIPATNPNAFRSEPALGLAEGKGVDRDANVIYGAALMQLGDINEEDARPFTVDEKTFQQVMKFSRSERQGFKSRFTHPNMSSDGLGSYLGRWKNIRRDGDFIRGDLHIADSAFDTPNGDLGNYVMNLAEDDPNAFGTSLAGFLDRKAMEREKLANGKMPIRYQTLRAADVVDTPAASHSGFFSADFNEPNKSQLPVYVTWILDNFFAEADPELVRGRFESFLRRYYRIEGDDMSQENQTAEATAQQTQQTTEQPTPAAKKTETEGNGNLATVDPKEAEALRLKQVKALCHLSGLSKEDTEAFVESGMSRAEVQSYLKDTDQLGKARPLIPGDGGGDLQQKKEPEDENSAYKKEYAELKASVDKIPFSEAEYIRSRRIDDGLSVLGAKDQVA